MNEQVPTRYPFAPKSVDTSGVKMRIRDLYQRIARRPYLELMYVQAVTSPTLTLRKIGTTVDIEGVRCVGWGTITLPSAGTYVWTLWMDGGSNPIAIGMQ